MDWVRPKRIKYVPAQSGELRYDHGFAVTDVEIWQSKYMLFQKQKNIEGKNTYGYNFLGFIYSPLIVLDQTLVHTTNRLISDTP